MKLKNKLQLAAFFMGILMLTACTVKDENTAALAPPVPTPPGPTPPEPPTPKQAGLLGKWVIKCIESKDVTGYYYNETFTFEDNILLTRIIYHKKGTPGSDKCTPESSGFSAELDSQINLGKVTSPGSKDEHTDINITTTQVKLKPMDAAHVAHFNDPDWKAGIYTGLRQTDWLVNYWKDVSNIPGAIKVFNIRKSMPDIFQVSKDLKDAKVRMLKLGDKNNDLDPDKRPIFLDNNIIAVFAGPSDIIFAGKFSH